MRKAAAVVVVFALGIPESSAQTTDVCKQVNQAVNHPAQFVTEKVQQCIMRRERRWERRIWRTVMVAANPVCCTPAWPTNPSCYIASNRKVKDAFTETKSFLQCEKKELSAAFAEFMRWRFDPRYVVIKDLKVIADYGASILLVIREEHGRPLPDSVKARLKEYKSKLSLYFENEDIEKARWISSDNRSARPFAPFNKDTHDSITWGNLIIAGPGLRSSSSCEQLESWAHELTHVAQYRHKGFERFLVDYLNEIGKDGYNNAKSEKEAVQAGEAVKKHCEEMGQARDVLPIK